MSDGRVQDCGCIALPEELQRQTGLYPGARFTIELSADGISVKLTVTEPGNRVEHDAGVQCTSAN